MNLKEAIKEKGLDQMVKEALPEIRQFVVRENAKKPGEPIFVMQNGKVGFPTINSLSVKIGDTVKGKIQMERDTYFLFEVTEIVKN